MPFQCSSCSSKFSRKSSLSRHFSQKHLGLKNSPSCFLCGLAYQTYDELKEHHKHNHKSSRYFEIRESAYRKAIVSYRYIFDSDAVSTPTDCLDDFLKGEIKKVIEHESLKRNSIKFSTIFVVEMCMLNSQDEIISKAIIPFRSETFPCVPLDLAKIKTLIDKAFNSHLERIDDFINNGSNWVFDRAIAMDIEMATSPPIMIGCSRCEEHGKIVNVDTSELPARKNLIDIPSRRNECLINCLAWFLLSSSEKKSNMRKNCRRLAKKFNTDRMRFPVQERDIQIFLKNNAELNLSINIFFHFEKKIYPYLIAQGKGHVKANLLMIQLGEGEDGRSINHFLVINNLDRFLTKSYAKISKQVSYENKFFCPNCLSSFTRKIKRDAHFQSCTQHKAVVEKVPDPESNKIKFVKFENCFPQDLIAYLDFECELSEAFEKCGNCDTIRCKCDMSYTRKENDHHPICFSFVILSGGKILVDETFAGEKAEEKFLDMLLDLESLWIKKYLSSTVAMKELSVVDQNLYDSSILCYMCNERFTKSDPKVRDHDHQTGLFMGPAHNSCNLRRRRQKYMKIFLHNGSSYDFHFIVKAITKQSEKIRNLYLLPYNMENFRMIKFNSFIFLDSIAFLQASLSSLADDLKNSDHDYPIIKQTDLATTNGEFDKRKFKMILQKGFFCYDYW